MSSRRVLWLLIEPLFFSPVRKFWNLIGLSGLFLSDLVINIPWKRIVPRSHYSVLLVNMIRPTLVQCLCIYLRLFYPFRCHCSMCLCWSFPCLLLCEATFLLVGGFLYGSVSASGSVVRRTALESLGPLSAASRQAGPGLTCSWHIPRSVRVFSEKCGHCHRCSPAALLAGLHTPALGPQKPRACPPATRAWATGAGSTPRMAGSNRESVSVSNPHRPPPTLATLLTEGALGPPRSC